MRDGVLSHRVRCKSCRWLHGICRHAPFSCSSEPFVVVFCSCQTLFFCRRRLWHPCQLEHTRSLHMECRCSDNDRTVIEVHFVRDHDVKCHLESTDAWQNRRLHSRRATLYQQTKTTCHQTINKMIFTTLTRHCHPRPHPPVPPALHPLRFRYCGLVSTHASSSEVLISPSNVESTTPHRALFNWCPRINNAAL